MSVFRPRSFLQLVLLGFVLVTLPLIIATINAAFSVGRLADQSQQAVHDAVQVTQSSRMLVEHLINQERYARQYHVLGDVSLFDTYITAHQHLVSLTSDMARLPLDDYQQRQLDILIRKENDLFEKLQLNPRESEESQDAITEFASLNEIAQSILSQGNDLINRQLDSVQSAAVKAQRMLVWQALAVIPGTLLFATIFVTLISRPIRQIRRAIRQLGEGDFTTEVAISGPRDLEALGQGLDWLRTRLLDLEQAKGKFLGQVSHELKTPLAAMREGVELLAEGVVGKINSSQLEIVEILQAKTRHLQSLIENLINFSMAHARSAVLSRQQVPLHHLLKDVETDHKPSILAKGVDLDLSSSEVIVPGDREQLRIVIDNLLSNTVKYSPDGGTIRVLLQRQTDHAILDVIDSGPGLSSADQDMIFEAFYQGKAPVGNATIKGNGLGLAIARDYIIAHDGTIEAITDQPIGAHFRITLPLR